MLEHETLTAMNEERRAKLAAAAKTYVEAPANLRALVAEAGVAGDKPAEITKAIDHALTYDYVARLVREAKAAVRES